MNTVRRATILVVDDDEVVRRLVRRILAGDFDLLEADGPAAAIAVADAAPGPIDLLLTDLMMPGGGGERLALNLCTRMKDLRVLYMTGYAAEGDASRPRPCLQKPFTSRTLRDGVDRALGVQAS